MSELNGPLAIPVSTVGTIPGRETVDYKGVCFGLIARSTGFSKGFSGSIKALRKGEVKQFTETLEEARRVAVERMVEHAQSLGANAVVGLRFDSTDMGEQQGMAEIVAYGTAIVID
ncbi:MAG: YbjQ family protein [Actinomycetota bacterium]|nr:YbjQ family protein [Actinomycetota bacterium]